MIEQRQVRLALSAPKRCCVLLGPGCTRSEQGLRASRVKTLLVCKGGATVVPKAIALAAKYHVKITCGCPIRTTVLRAGGLKEDLSKRGALVRCLEYFLDDREQDSQ